MSHPRLADVLPALVTEIENGLRKAGREDLAATVGGLLLHRCQAESSFAYLYVTAKTLTAREAQELRRDRSISTGELERRLAHSYKWPPDETIVLPRVRVCLWDGAIEQFDVVSPGMNRPALRKLARQFPGA